MIRSEIRYFISDMEYIPVEQGNSTVDYMLDRWKNDCIDRIKYGAKNGIIQSYSIDKKSSKSIKGTSYVELTLIIRYKYGFDMIQIEIYDD